MWTAAIAVLTASVVGSAHCVGMCGGFPAILVTGERRSYLNQVYYHLGRLVTYAGLGMVAGWLGQSVNDMGAMMGLQKLAAYLTGVVLIIFGLQQIFQMRLSWQNKISAIFPMQKWLAYLKRKPSWGASLGLGLAAGFLPCGWLYSFVVVAAGSGTPLAGGVIMSFFWIGTVPALVSVATFGEILKSKLGPKLPLMTGTLFIVAGLFAFFHRVTVTGHLQH